MSRRPIAVLLDLDGTLVDTLELILSSVRGAFDGWRGRRPTDADWIAGIGKPLRVQLAEFASGPEELDALVARYRECFWANHDRMTRPFPGSAGALAALRAAGHPLGVVTAKLEETAWRSLRLAGLGDYVAAVVGADSLPEHKPDPAPVRLLLSRLDRAPGEALLVGDSPHDLAAGRGAGVVTAAALWGACPAEALLAAGPDHALGDVSEIPALVAARQAGDPSAFRPSPRPRSP